MAELITLPRCCFYPRWVPTSQSTETQRAWKCYNCWEVAWMPIDFRLDVKISEYAKQREVKRLG